MKYIMTNAFGSSAVSAIMNTQELYCEVHG